MATKETKPSTRMTTGKRLNDTKYMLFLMTLLILCQFFFLHWKSKPFFIMLLLMGVHSNAMPNFRQRTHFLSKKKNNISNNNTATSHTNERKFIVRRIFT